MRIKVFILVCLFCAIMISATVGTLSAYTVSTSGFVGIEPNTQKIQKQADSHKKQLQTEASEAGTTLEKDEE